MTAKFVSHRLIRWVAIFMLMTVSPITVFAIRPVSAQTAPTVTIELQGAITALTGTTLVVNGLTIDASTAQVKGTLIVGAFVKVEGTLQADNTVKASEVSVVPATGRQETELTGVVDSITTSVIVISGQSFDITSAQIGAGVVVGAHVKIHFALVNGAFVAREVTVAPAQRDRQELELTGTVESITDTLIVVAGQSFNITSAEIGSGVVVGAQVKVHYSVVNGVNVAREVKLAAASGRDDNDPRRGGNDDGPNHDAGDDHGGDDNSGRSGRGGDDNSGRGSRSGGSDDNGGRSGRGNDDGGEHH